MPTLCVLAEIIDPIATSTMFVPNCATAHFLRQGSMPGTFARIATWFFEPKVTEGNLHLRCVGTRLTSDICFCPGACPVPITRLSDTKDRSGRVASKLAPQTPKPSGF